MIRNSKHSPCQKMERAWDGNGRAGRNGVVATGGKLETGLNIGSNGWALGRLA